MGSECTVWALHTRQGFQSGMCRHIRHPSIHHRYRHRNKFAHAAVLVPKCEMSLNSECHFTDAIKPITTSTFIQRLFTGELFKWTPQHFIIIFYGTKRIYFYSHPAVVVMCSVHPVFKLLTSTVIVIPLSYLPVSIHNIVSNSLAKGLPALCPTG